jgi:(R,R)-butanediol dehydrogenase / meso-butanediol dehydrogenase / diacetyl reductase
MSSIQAAFYEGNRSIRVGDCVPVSPGPSEVQIQVSYCGICGTDLHIFHGRWTNASIFRKS